MAQPQIAYILKMYPRFSETFILNEVLELERQGMRLQIFALKKPDDGRFHADVSRVQANTTYLPESPLLAPRAFYEAHRQVFAWNRGHYLRLLLDVLKRRRFGALKRFLQAGYIAPRLHQQGITHVHAHFATSATSVALYLHRLGVSRIASRRTPRTSTWKVSAPTCSTANSPQHASPSPSATTTAPTC